MNNHLKIKSVNLAKDKSFRKTFKRPVSGNFIHENQLGPELTMENCSPELWAELSAKNEIDDKDLPF